MRSRTRFVLTVAAVTALTAAAAAPASAWDGSGRPRAPRPDFTLTILHNNDGESSLLPTTVADVSYGGVARFQRKVDTLRVESYLNWDRGESFRRGVLLLNSGDNFLASPQFQASQQPGAPFYDATAVRLLRYDALGVGNHEFDFGPDTFARFVDQVGNAPFVTANLDVSDEPSLAALAAADRLVSSTIVRASGERVGVVGLTTPVLATISSPGAVDVLDDLAGIAQAEIDGLTARGIDKIVLISHLQGLQSEIALTGQLHDVDVVIGGGGDEVLAGTTTALFPGDETRIFGTYPQLATNADGIQVPVVTTPGNYRYVGDLQVTFDRDGHVLSYDPGDSGLRLVTGSGPEAVGESRRQKTQVEEPVKAFVDGLAATVIGSSDVTLDCERVEVRGRESNCGDLLADGLLAAGRARAAQFGVPAPQVAVQNGGGIRGEIDQPAGPITLADTFRLAPFGNFVAVAPAVPAETLRQLVEQGAIRLPAAGEGGFVQLAGATVVIDPSFPARVATTAGEQVSPGQRVRSLVLDDGTVLVQDGVARDVTVSVAGLNFSLNGGDRYPKVPFTTLGITDQQALQSYIQDTLGGQVTGVQYPREGLGRITIR